MKSFYLENKTEIDFQVRRSPIFRYAKCFTICDLSDYVIVDETVVLRSCAVLWRDSCTYKKIAINMYGQHI